MNIFDKKKLAIIKSNAAPEVKLKALEKLNAGSKADYQKAFKQLNQASNLVGLAAQAGPDFRQRLLKLEHAIEEVRMEMEYLIRGMK